MIFHPHKRFSSVSEIIPVHTNTPENVHNVTIHVHRAHALRCKQETDHLLCSWLLSLGKYSGGHVFEADARPHYNPALKFSD